MGLSTTPARRSVRTISIPRSARRISKTAAALIKPNSRVKNSKVIKRKSVVKNVSSKNNIADAVATELQEIDQEEYEIEAIQGHKTIKGKILYLVKWVGYSDEESTWESIENLNDKEILEDYLKNNPDKPKNKLEATVVKTLLQRELPNEPCLLISAPGKVILFGEHAVVYQKTATAASIDLRSYLRYQPRDDDQIYLNFIDFDLKDYQISMTDILECKSIIEMEDVEKICEQVSQELLEKISSKIKPQINSERQAIVAFLYLLVAIHQRYTKRTPTEVVISSNESLSKSPISDIPVADSNTVLDAVLTTNAEVLRGFELAFKTQLPVGAGVGSSASFSVCIASALLYKYNAFNSINVDFSDKDVKNLINQWAFLSEKILHGNPSGVDNAVCTYGGALQYNTGTMTHIQEFKTMKFLLVDTKTLKNTKFQVENVKLRYDKFPEPMKMAMDAIHNISIHSKNLFDSVSEKMSLQQYSDVETLIEINQGFLNAIGVGHHSINKVCDITKEYGFYSKLTGGGGGGCVLTFLKDASKARVKEVIQSLKKEGFRCYEADIGCPGVQGRKEVHMDYSTFLNGLKFPSKLDDIISDN